MAHHDLTALDDHQFEALCCQLLSKEYGKRFERFKPGKDLGIDGRFFSDSEESEAILQCKHWARSTTSALLRSLRDQELPKIKKLSPSRYIFATSLPLSRADKKRISSIFAGYMQSESEIYGYEDISDLISKHTEVYKSHPNLWLSSAEVIGLITNAAIRGRSEFSLSEIRENAIRYVKTTSHLAAKNILERLGAVLITGIPGIGKTTLAEQLLLEYVLKGYELCVLSHSIEEAEAIYKKDGDQIFYFDDFLGRNYLEALNRHEDSRIVDFINRIRKDAKKKFVLTSRTTVLTQAKILSDRFAIAKIDRSEFELRVEALSALDRAQILHKHIWYSRLAPEFVGQILSSKRYRAIIDHPNFNPRLIQFVTDSQRIDDPNPESYWPYIGKTLSNPAAIWEHVFESQLDDFSRALLLIVVFNGNSLSEPELREAFEKVRQSRITSSYSGSNDFVRNARLVTGSVLNRNIVQGGGVSYSLFNPSIADYVFKRAPSDSELLRVIYSSLNSYSSISTIKSLTENRLISKTVASNLIRQLVDIKLPKSKLAFRYRLSLVQLAIKLGIAHGSYGEMIRAFLSVDHIDDEAFSDWGILADVLDAGLRQGYLSTEACLPYFEFFFSSTAVNIYELGSMLEVFDELDPESQALISPQFREYIVSFWEDYLPEAIAEESDFCIYTSDDDYSEVTAAIDSFVESKLSDYPFVFSEGEIARIKRYTSASEIINDNIKAATNNYAGRNAENPSQSTSEELIDDLFAVDFPATN